ncbi:DUF4292 domain-containing protein [Altibacter sp. HG106]|uniref:DUF4292 domain-containing protein n=1 Tax=Altibacter sp. HG106 TaxID=3023937 RepID=UPI002350CE83|nr:DUF4292 domain-containing protein [Altibacter sp. HG106]MDC7995038.1 DUF4292 domain-containing protein [Altibacter sp. HG106]
MTHRILSLLLVLSTLVVTSCGGTKKTLGALPNLSSKEIISKHQQTAPQFNTLAARVQVVYEDEKKLQSMTVSLRMEKDKQIWVKASLLGITLAKVYITPSRVSYYETVGDTYFDGDFSLLSEWLGAEIDFERAQAILLGQSLFDLNDTAYEVSGLQNLYRLQPKRQEQNFIYSLLIDPNHFRVSGETLSQPNDNRLLDVRYEDYQLVSSQHFPSAIKILASENNTKTSIDVTYRKIDLDANVSFPFDIPEGYEEIKL